MLIPYTDFVRGLFIKPAEPEGKLVHAAVGMVGELVELLDAIDRANQREELGDLMFYLVAGYNTLVDLDPKLANFRVVAAKAMSLADCQTAMLRGCALFLDQAKKAWIYRKPLDPQALVLFAGYAYTISDLLDQLITFYGFTRQEVELDNRLKLVKRYAGAQYTDAAAQARADKPAGQ